MIARRAGIVAVALIAGAVAAGWQTATAGEPAAWSEVKWPFPIDQWGTGRAFHCRAADCGARPFAC